MEYYNFDNVEISPLVFPLQESGKELVGVELGVWHAVTGCTLLQRIPNITKLYFVDPFLPYKDDVYSAEFDEKVMNYAKLTAHHNVYYSGCKDRAVFVEAPEDKFCETLKDESLDFIFMDVWPEPKDIQKQLSRWYKKIKVGGIFSGHEADQQVVMENVYAFNKSNSTTPVSKVNSKLWMWRK
jgi:hypothetical protein